MGVTSQVSLRPFHRMLRRSPRSARDVEVFGLERRDSATSSQRAPSHAGVCRSKRWALTFVRRSWFRVSEKSLLNPRKC